jgi:ERCC4-type nuclease
MTRTKLPEPTPTIVVDTREQTPWSFAPWLEVRRALDFGDYAIDGHESLIAIERKSIVDFVGSVTVGHENEWEKQARAKAAGVPFVYIVEGYLYECLTPEVLLTKSPATVEGAVNSMLARGIPVIFAGSRVNAVKVARAFFMYHWEKLPMKVRRGVA